MRKKLRALLVPVATAAAAVAMSAAPAEAATGYDRCPVDNYCMFSGLDGTGDMIALTGNTPDLAALGMDDRALSDWNRTDSTIHLFSEAGYTGCTAITSPGWSGKGNFAVKYRAYFSSLQFDGPGGMSCGTPPGEG